ncbi:MAG: SUMF1/EgtB/PvdO family nonheme iron enzyme [Candidatus Delongbacteria bacterium]|nr:SUMF1/EgtB/PvdO family nonheme iron enzyme [Candidatus Delongbacteria bacterium]
MVRHDTFRMPRLLLVTMTCLLLTLSCEDDSDGSEGGPLELQLRAIPATVPPGGLTTLSCEVTHSGWNTPECSWSSTEGYFPSGTAGMTVLWRAPPTSGAYSITVEVDDAVEVHVGTMRVTVRGGVGNLPAMVSIPARQFTMGDPAVAESPRQVALSNAYLLGIHEVTNKEYCEALQWAYDQGLVTVEGEFIKQHGEYLIHVGDYVRGRLEIPFDAESERFGIHAGTDDTMGYGVGPGNAYPHGYDPANHPVQFVSWFGAACYCDWKSQMEGLPLTYDGNWEVLQANSPYESRGYRLPTEAEWEYAARYDDNRIYPWGDTDPVECMHANFNLCVGWSTPVGSYGMGTNTLGLQDMAGNVWEWCNDWYGDYSNDAQVDPLGPGSGFNRCMRGGGWGLTADNMRSASRDSRAPIRLTYGLGFRVCRTR